MTIPNNLAVYRTENTYPVTHPLLQHSINYTEFNKLQQINTEQLRTLFKYKNTFFFPNHDTARLSFFNFFFFLGGGGGGEREGGGGVMNFY